MPKAKITLTNIKKFITGWTRWILFKLNGNKFIRGFAQYDLLPTHQQEQFRYRLMVMNDECLNSGKCVICGCQTPQLQLADEACEGECYPEMMNEKDWKTYKTENNVIL